MPPNALPTAQTTRPQPALARAAPRLHQPRGPTSRSSPIPSWIHTVEAAAAAGWLAHTVVPESTKRCTQPGDVAAAGLITPSTSPVGIPDWSCRSPSNTQVRPKAIRRNRRPAGSGSAGATTGGNDSPRATARRYCMDRSWFQPTKRTATSTSTRAPWVARSWWNEAMIEPLPGPGGPPIPVMGGRRVKASAPRYRPALARR